VRAWTEGQWGRGGGGGAGQWGRAGVCRVACTWTHGTAHAKAQLLLTIQYSLLRTPRTHCSLLTTSYASLPITHNTRLAAHRAAHAQPQLLLEERKEEGARTAVQLLEARLVGVGVRIRVGLRVRVMVRVRVRVRATARVSC
jgi:MarR-like DNA-binding transcriptional regulator SgrR of sgrS sRNA